jgi:hypothetical protein
MATSSLSNLMVGLCWVGSATPTQKENQNKTGHDPGLHTGFGSERRLREPTKSVRIVVPHWHKKL